MKRWSLLAPVILCGALLLTLAPEQSHGCAVVPLADQRVDIADESALIVWDAASRTEHFIRRASFNTAAEHFGFLVPTPTKPELAEVDNSAFTTVASFTRPRIENRTRYTLEFSGLGTAAKSTFDAPGSALADVRVLDRKRVAGYDAVVLEADDPQALNNWLEKHGYPSRPVLTRWLETYVKARWKITAFKMAWAPQKEATIRSAKAVRMSFQTDRPFYPYREPEDMRASDPKTAPARLLRVFLLSQQRMNGTLGSDGRWPGQLVHAAPEPSARPVLHPLLNLPGGDSQATWWVNEYEDHSSPRPGIDEVYFSPASEQEEVRRPPIIRYTNVPLGDYILGGVVAGVIVLLSVLMIRAWWRETWRKGAE